MSGTNLRLADLRTQAPSWTWAGERYGFGWIYRGERKGKTVRVSSRCFWVGPSDDDWASRWYVDDGAVAKDWYSWLLEQETPPGNRGEG